MSNQTCAGIHNKAAFVPSERRFGVQIHRVGTLRSAAHHGVNLMPLKRYPVRSQIRYTLRTSRKSGLPSIGIRFRHTFVDQLLPTMLLSSSICESGIDALSYHALHRPAQAHDVSIAGEMNPMQKILLASAMQKLPHGGTVIAATDHDPGGAHLARKIREIAAGAARPDLGVIDHRPETEGQDWNDVQRALVPVPKPDSSPAGTAGRPGPCLNP